MSFTAQLIRAERKKRGMKQVELAAKAGCVRAKISRIENGMTPTKEDLEMIARALNSMYLRILALGTTSQPVIFNNINDEFYIAACRFKQECLEAVDALDKVLKQSYNIRNIEDCSKEQKEIIEYALLQTDDINHACNILDCAAHELGFDIEKRNRKNLEKYRRRNYLTYGARPDVHKVGEK